MRKNLFAILCCFANTLFAQSTNPSVLVKRLSGIDAQINRVMKDWKVAGIAVAVVYKSTVIFEKGYGYRDLENKLPVSAHTVFPIASCTKAFTAMLVGMAAEKKLLDINRPVHQYFPALEFYTPEMTKIITVKDMMTHRTGLPRHDWATDARDQIPLDTMIHRIRYPEPSKGIREEVQYNNLMYQSLGGLIARVTGQSWSQQMQELIFTPLEMTESSTRSSDLFKNTEYSKGYFVRRDTIVAGSQDREFENGAGSINASVADMSNWLVAWINNGRFKGKQILPKRFVIEASIPQMSTPSRPNPAFPAYPDCYFGDVGYGWIIDSYRGHYHVQHSGDLPLYSSNTAFFPTDSIGIVVLVNKFNATIPEMVSSYIADRLLNLPKKDWNTLLLALQKKRAADEIRSAQLNPAIDHIMPRPLNDYTGTFTHPGYGVIKIILSNQKLIATHNDKPIAFLPKSSDRFKANVPGGELKIISGNNGEIIALSGSFEDDIKDIVFRKVPQTK
ncbi:serine hydrolase [Mucilaginibacter sp. S1162]|uniref:Serine hydrolase n=1 Tax=Mucilaginibacter humi TaxID=2732510 RepID=A0ABX1W0U8_9SPHI|nr:serine hydrolase [Mucilaginibacter humi]NNU33852.1 serine hydrolase [Mucilaginibacter humi]